ncbi:MAG: hypothetical protein AAF290_16525 [Pseudomonadota bacterium]
MARLVHQYLGNFPSDHDSDWTESLQGVAHDAAHWYFTQKTQILKFHVSTTLTSNKRSAVSRTSMPAALRRLGGNHFGDPDHLQLGNRGYLVVPVESEDSGAVLGRQPHLAVFRTDTNLRFVGSAPLVRQNASEGTSRAGWLAINPTNQLIYSSTNRINRTKPIFRYKLDVNALLRGDVTLTATTNVVLKKPNGREPITIPRYLQGGTFSNTGELYLLNGKIGGRAGDGGIRVFNRRGVLIDRSTVRRSQTNRFRYQFKPGWRTSEEPEGITFWDLDQLRKRTNVPNKLRGQLHALLLDVQVGRKDNIWFKHYKVQRIAKD